MRIGEAVKLRILELCDKYKFTINSLSTISGVPQSTLNNIISGRNNGTNVTTIQKLCDGWQISIIDFFNVPLFADIEQEIK